MIDFVDYRDANTTIIEEKTVLEGNINIKGSLEVIGAIKGNAHVDGLLRVYGQIDGGVDSRDMLVRKNGKIKGKVKLLLDGCVEQGGIVYGDVECENIEVLGYIEGDVSAVDTIIVRNTGYINGDVKCKTLAVDTGGYVNGNVTIAYNL